MKNNSTFLKRGITNSTSVKLFKTPFVLNFSLVKGSSITLLLFLVLFFIQCKIENRNENANRQSFEFPVLKHYDQQHIDKIALPLGGIGTGTVSLGGRGDLRDWEIMNRPGKGFKAGPGGNRHPFFAIFIDDGTEKQSSALLGPIPISEYESKEGRKPDNHGLPRFRNCSFDAAYPFGTVNLSDPRMPVDVKIKGYNPLIPGDADASGIPIAILKYEITNITGKPLTVSVCGVMENFIGADGETGNRDWKGDFRPLGARNNKNKFRKSGIEGVFMYSEGVEPMAEQWGTMALTTDTIYDVSYRTSFINRSWGDALLDFWDDFSNDGTIEDRTQPVMVNDPNAALAVKTEIAAYSKKEISFYLTWHFPNRKAWSSEIVGNYYTTKYKDAWDVIEKTKPRLPYLENKTKEWVTVFAESNLPEVVKEAALFNISTLRSQTVFRIKSGQLMGWEGCMDTRGSCMGSCTHVWNYEQATAFLFGELAKTMREVEFGYSTCDNGLMYFRTSLPLSHVSGGGVAAADGQMGTIMKMYRDWQLSGDDNFLNELWPNVKKAVGFCWIPGGWDDDMDGVMDGCQHNTMDVEYYGPNQQMQLWYLGALRAAEEMANYKNDVVFAEKCRSLFEKGSEWTDKNLFNGEYYIQLIQPPAQGDSIAPGLTHSMGAKNRRHPDYQIGEGCLVDQLVGQYMAHVLGLGYLVQPENIKTTLASILKYNHRENMWDHFNPMRSYVLGDEAGLLMASFPKSRPKVPFPYFHEMMTGFEYTAAIGMLYENMENEGLSTITDIRNRYDGNKRSPFDEAECGHHYARAMASWAAPIALTGFSYSGVSKQMKFKAVKGDYFWSNGYSYGTIKIESKGAGYSIRIKSLGGNLELKAFELRGKGTKEFDKLKVIGEGKDLKFEI